MFQRARSGQERGDVDRDLGNAQRGPGAFGHSRVYEALFGGVSLDLLRQPSLPVLMSH